MYASDELAHHRVHIPLPARVLLPVVPSAVLYKLTLEPCVIVWFDPLLLTIVIASPAEKTALGTVTPPVVMYIALPASAATKV